MRRLDGAVGPESWVTPRALAGERVEPILQTIRNLRSGREFVARCGATPMFEGDRLVATILTIENVTAEVRARQAIESALSAAEVGTWRVDLRIGRAWGDPNFARLYGSREADLRDVPVSRLYDPVHAADRARVERELADPSDAHECEFRIVLPNGAVRWLLLRGRVERAGEGVAVERLGSVVDVTGRKRAEAEALRAVEQYRALAEVAATVVFAADPHGALTEIPLVRGLYTDEAQRGLGEGWLSAVHPDDRASAGAAWMQAIATGEPYLAEFRLHMADGSPRWHAARGVRVVDGAGETREWVRALTDVHERMEAERSIGALNAELERRVEERTQELTRANRDLHEFSYSVAHDLRAPLRAIVSTSRVLMEDLDDRMVPDERETLRRQSTNALRLARIVDDLLSFARLAKADLRRESFDMTRLVRHAADEVASRWPGDRGVEIQEAMRAEGDPNLVGYMLTNLLDNACKFSPEGGTIRVGEADGAFFVRDEGVGFDMAHAHKLFVAFERLVDQETFPGTGVGLANVKRIVERHGGRAWAESEPGKGATLWFTLAG